MPAASRHLSRSGGKIPVSSGVHRGLARPSRQGQSPFGLKGGWLVCVRAAGLVRWWISSVVQCSGEIYSPTRGESADFLI